MRKHVIFIAFRIWELQIRDPKPMLVSYDLINEKMASGRKTLSWFTQPAGARADCTPRPSDSRTRII